MDDTPKQQPAKTRLLLTVAAIVVVGLVIVVIDALKPKATAPATKPSSSPAAATSATSSGYKNGTYAETADYDVPSGSENIKVTLTLANGVISTVAIKNSESNPTSVHYQSNFASGYQSQVVGHKISGLQINAVAGASNTTRGFNQALSQIASQAKV